MNRTIIYKTFLLVACMGCTGNLPENNEAETALQLSSVSIHEEGISKAIVAGTTVNTVNVYVAKTDNTVYDPTVPSLVFTNKSGNWTSDKSVVILDGTPAKVYGVYPDNIPITDEGGSLKVSVEVLKGGGNTLDFQGTQQNDYLYSGEVDASYQNRTISLAMKHAMAKVSLDIVKATNVTAPLVLKQVKILSGTNLLQAGTGYMLLNGTTTGALNGLASTSEITLDNSVGMELKTSHAGANVTCLVAPMNTAESVLSFSLTVGEEGSSVNRTFLTSSISPAVKWVAGFHYVYKITVNKMSGDVEGVLIEDWRNDASQNTSVGI